MKTQNFKYIFTLIMMSFFMTSCLVDDDTLSDGFNEGPQLFVGFSSSAINATAIADGNLSSATIPLEISGIASNNYNTELTATIAVDPSSTAVSGTHYTLSQNTVTLDPDNFMLGFLPVEIITADIDAPSEETLVLNIAEVTGDSQATPNGRTSQVTISIKYLCPSDLAGTYNNPDVPSGAAGQATITETGSGEYTISAMPYLGWGGTDPISINIIHNCDQVQITGGELMEAGYLIVGGGTYDDTTGDITITYTVYNGETVDTGVFFDFSTSPSTYSPQ